MSRRGFPPEPMELKVLKDHPGRRAVHRQDVKLPAELPEAPKDLDAVARTEWQRIGGLLREAGLATSADFAALVCYCTVWSRWRAVQQALTLEGLVIQRKGSPALHPLFKAWVEFDPIEDVSG